MRTFLAQSNYSPVVNYLQNFAQHFAVAVTVGSVTLVYKLTKRGHLGFPFQDLTINSHNCGSDFQIGKRLWLQMKNATRSDDGSLSLSLSFSSILLFGFHLCYCKFCRDKYNFIISGIL